MGSRSKSGKHRKGSRKDRNESFDFWQRVLDVIAQFEAGELVSWNYRALLYTRFTARLPAFCERHGLGVADGYVDVIHRLVKGKKLEFFDRDALKRLKKLLHTITKTANRMQADVDLVVH